jgi:hypothetical protein
MKFRLGSKAPKAMGSRVSQLSDAAIRAHFGNPPAHPQGKHKSSVSPILGEWFKGMKHPN